MAPIQQKKGVKPPAHKLQSSERRDAAKSKISKPKSKAERNTANGGQIKTKRSSVLPPHKVAQAKSLKKKRSYTDKDLGLPSLNAIVPSGLEKPRGKKKGKVFVDDAESMRTILAVVSAEREGRIESKMIKARRLEELREARRAEMEKRDAERQARFDEIKSGVKRKRSKAKEEVEDDGVSGIASERVAKKGGKKKVSFG